MGLRHLPPPKKQQQPKSSLQSGIIHEANLEIRLPEAERGFLRSRTGEMLSLFIGVRQLLPLKEQTPTNRI